MPKSKRARPIYLYGPKKKTRQDKENLITNVRAALEKFNYVYVLEVRNMRNTYLKDVRNEFSGDGRLFFGKTTILSIALGRDPSSSLLPGLHALSPHLSNNNKPNGGTADANPRAAADRQTGLLLTNRSPHLVRSFFSTFSPLDFARSGTVAVRTVVIPPGEVYAPASLHAKGNDDDGDEKTVPVAASREPELRKLGVPTRLVKGKVMCEVEGSGDDDMETETETRETGYVVCREGRVLDSRQTALLKFLGERMAVFQVGIKAHWSSGTGEVIVEGTEGMEVDSEMEGDE